MIQFKNIRYFAIPISIPISIPSSGQVRFGQYVDGLVMQIGTYIFIYLNINNLSFNINRKPKIKRKTKKKEDAHMIK